MPACLLAKSRSGIEAAQPLPSVVIDRLTKQEGARYLGGTRAFGEY
jgi:hypothetical protein